MAGIVAPILSSFNAGELSPYLDARVDMAKFSNGCQRMENFIPTVQGPAKRRMGTRFANEVKNSANRTWLAEFKFSETQALVLEFGPLYIRFYLNNGYVESSPGVPYEIVTPYGVGDLTNADGTFGLSMAQTGDVIFITDGSSPVQKLTRIANDNWTLAAADIKNGPFIGTDPDETITVQASGATGVVTITASSPIFTADDIGTQFLIEQPAVDAYKVWEVNKAIVIGNERRSDSNVYIALNAANTGSIKPTHLEGAKFDGDDGVQWEYEHSGYGSGLITAIGGGGTTATMTVQVRLPSTVVSGTTTRWSKSAWSADRGYPEFVCFFRERLTLFRKAKGWFSVTADFENFANRDGADTVPDSAISIDITTSELNDVTFLVPGKSLLVGTTGAEFAISEISTSEVFGPGNVKAEQQTKHGSRPVKPLVINDSVLMVQKTGRRVRDLRFSFDSDGYQTVDLQVLSTEIARGRIIQGAYAEEPDSVAWYVCQSGELIALTFNREQDVIGWHRHPLGGDGFAESVACIPTPDGDQDQLWVIVRRTIDGVTRRYVEYLEPEWRADTNTLSEAVYSDSVGTFDGSGQPGTIQPGAAFSGPDSVSTLTSSAGAFLVGHVGRVVYINFDAGNWTRFEITAYTSANVVTARQIDAMPEGWDPGVSTYADWAFGVLTITGLDYLEGMEVAILADGATHPTRTVSGGEITLQRHAVVAQVGLVMTGRLVTMRIEAGAQNGTAQGKIKRIHRVTLRLFEAMNGRVGGEQTQDQILYRSSSSPMNQPPGIRSGDYETPFPDGYNTTGRIVILANDPTPMTVVGIFPQLETSDRT
jgi:hypothetical protein